MGLPKDVSAVVSFLASEEASFLTGITVDISGGQFMP
jgi:NAD(P)-dependent dehydrogenase (short-subunit alcohol dehydrogenase family)